jgi:hypothetical protein
LFDVLADAVCVANNEPITDDDTDNDTDYHCQHHQHCFTEPYPDPEPNSHAIHVKHTAGDSFPNEVIYFERHTDDIADFVEQSALDAVAESNVQPTGIPECKPHDIADSNQQPGADCNCNFKLHARQHTIWDFHSLSDFYGLAIRDPI